MPRAALEVTAKDDKGNVVFTERRRYENWNLWLEGGKEVELRLWDITATTNVNLGLEPGIPDERTNVVLLDKDAKSATVEVKFLYEHTPDNWETVKTVTKTFNVHSVDQYYKKK